MKKKVSSGLYATIDIGSTAIKAVVVEVTDKGKRLLRAESEEINPTNGFNSEEEYKEFVSSAIAKLTKNLRLDKCKKVSSLFYNRELQVKLIDLPNQVSKEQLDDVLVWEAKKLLSTHYHDKEFSFAYSIIKENPITVAIAVVPQELLESHLSLFEKTSIEPDAIYADVFSAISLRPIVDLAGLPALSIVNFGYSGTHLHIFSAGKLKFYRFIPTGTSELSNPPRENELEMYSQKIRFSFDYFRAVSKLNQVDTMYFMGGGSQYEEVLPFAQNYFSPTKIHAMDVSSALDISPVMTTNNDETSSNETKLLKYIPAIGACITSFEDDSERTNLLAQLNSKKSEKKLENLAQLIPAAIVALVTIVSYIIISTTYDQKIQTFQEFPVNLDSAKEFYKIDKNKLKTIKGNLANPDLILCRNSEDLVKQSSRNRDSLYKLFTMAMYFKKPNMEITDILVKNQAEADQISINKEDSLEDSNQDIEENGNIDEEISSNSSLSNQPNDDMNIFEMPSDNVIPNQEDTTISNKTNLTNNDFDIFGTPSNNDAQPIKNDAKKTEPQTSPKKNSKPAKNQPQKIFISKLATPIMEEQIKEDFFGKIAIIRGVAENLDLISEYTEKLSCQTLTSKKVPLPRAIKRIISLNVKTTDDGKIEFLLKGELNNE